MNRMEGNERITYSLRHIIILLILHCSFYTGLAQTASVNAAVNKKAILIGEPIQLKLEATLPVGTNAVWFSLDNLPHFELVEKAKIDTVEKENSIRLEQMVTITSFDSGQWVIPPLVLEVEGRSYLTDSFPVAVAFSPFDPAQEYHDIKTILEVENPYTRYITWAIAAITLLSLLAVIYFLRKRTAKVSPPVRQTPQVRSPYQQAMEALEELNSQQLPEKGQVKTYYTRLNDILREFIWRQKTMAAMQKTSEEIVLQVKQTGLSSDRLILLAQTLRMSDAVKFAKFVPGPEDNSHSFDVIKSSIEQLNNLDR